MNFAPYSHFFEFHLYAHICLGRHLKSIVTVRTTTNDQRLTKYYFIGMYDSMKNLLCFQYNHVCLWQTCE